MDNVLENRIILEDMQQIDSGGLKWERLKSKCIYITGASGMIASYIVYFLIYLNEIKMIPCEIYASARSSNKLYSRFGSYVDKKYFHFVESDACDEVRPQIKFDYIIHGASLASPQFYGNIPVDVILPNVLGTNQLLEHAVKYGCDSFIFFSTGSVYGDLGDETSVREDMYGKLDYLAPGNCYGESKRCGEALCEAYCRQYGVKAKIVRMFHVYGPTMNIQNDVRVFSEFMRNAANGEDIVLKSDGTASRAFCYLTDAVEAIFLALMKGEIGACYNIGNPYEYMKIAQLAEIVANLSNTNIRIEKREIGSDYQPSPEGKKTVMDISRIKQLGWQPKISTKEGFGRCLQYFDIIRCE